MYVYVCVFVHSFLCNLPGCSGGWKRGAVGWFRSRCVPVIQLTLTPGREERALGFALNFAFIKDRSQGTSPTNKFQWDPAEEVFEPMVIVPPLWRTSHNKLCGFVGVTPPEIRPEAVTFYVAALPKLFLLLLLFLFLQRAHKEAVLGC